MKLNRTCWAFPNTAELQQHRPAVDATCPRILWQTTSTQFCKSWVREGRLGIWGRQFASSTGGSGLFSAELQETAPEAESVRRSQRSAGLQYMPCRSLKFRKAVRFISACACVFVCVSFGSLHRLIRSFVVHARAQKKKKKTNTGCAANFVGTDSGTVEVRSFKTAVACVIPSKKWTLKHSKLYLSVKENKRHLPRPLGRR